MKIKIIIICIFVIIISAISFFLLFVLPYYGIEGQIIDGTVPSIRFKSVGFGEIFMTGVVFYSESGDYLGEENNIRDQNKGHEVVIDMLDYGEVYNTLLSDGRITVSVGILRTPFTLSEKFVLDYENKSYSITRLTSHYKPWWDSGLF